MYEASAAKYEWCGGKCGARPSKYQRRARNYEARTEMYGATLTKCGARTKMYQARALRCQIWLPPSVASYFPSLAPPFASVASVFASVVPHFQSLNSTFVSVGWPLKGVEWDSEPVSRRRKGRRRSEIHSGYCVGTRPSITGLHHSAPLSHA
jgi:hypothetical protein